MKIVVIHHRFEGAHWDPLGYVVGRLTPHWEAAGHKVVNLFGPDRYEPADVTLLHVDLSVVPKIYQRLGSRYPVLLNRRITDIRKRAISTSLLRANDPYEGPVIVKSDLNHAGVPEQIRLDQRRKWWQRPMDAFRTKAPPLLMKDYPVFDSLRDVPRAYFKDPDFVVEKFTPERDGALFCIRQAYFLGEKSVTWLRRSHEPVIRFENKLDDREIPTPAGLDIYRRKIGMDYGKIDFIEQPGGGISVLDVNKTIGRVIMPEMEKRIASGIESFFNKS